MDTEALALLIPIMALAIPVVAIWTKHKKDMLQMHADGTGDRAAQHASRVQELEDRVRVLERIVTDGGYDVAKQIEALRDQRQAEGRIEERTKL